MTTSHERLPPAPPSPATDYREAGRRLRIGMLLPSSNRVSEAEIPAMLPNGVALHTTRLKLSGGSDEELLAMSDEVEAGARLLADAGADPIAFHCTGVTTFAVGLDQTLQARIASSANSRAITTAEALRCGLSVLGVKRLVIVSPYSKAINDREILYLAHHGVETVHAHCLSLGTGAEFAAVEPDEWHRLTIEHQRDAAEAYFISCATIRAASVIDRVEAEVGKPVITSNQLIAWHALRSSGLDDRLSGFGALLSRY